MPSLHKGQNPFIGTAATPLLLSMSEPPHDTCVMCLNVKRAPRFRDALLLGSRSAYWQLANFADATWVLQSKRWVTW